MNGMKGTNGLAAGRGRGPMPGRGAVGTKPLGGRSTPSAHGVTAKGVAAAVSSSAERLIFGASVLIGYKVEVQVKNGTVFEGVFHAMKFEQKDSKDSTHIVLKYAKTLRDPAAKATDRDGVAEKPIQTLIIYSQDLVQVLAKDVKLNPEDLGTADTFDTDAAIGRGRGGVAGRELQKWDPEGPEDSSMFHLEDSGAGWDQFAVNQAKFGVTTTFNEDFYTTNLDKNRSNISERDAQRLAREIEAMAGGGGGAAAAHSNRHVAEERNTLVDDSGLDEEEKYSSVIREPAQPQQQQQHAPQNVHHSQHPHHHTLDPRRTRIMPTADGGHPPARSVWGSNGAWVAAVAGRGRPLHPADPHPRSQSSAGPDAGSRHAPAMPLEQPQVALPPSAPTAQQQQQAVAAASLVQPPPPPARTSSTNSNGSMSSPIDIDPRREANKVRQQLVHPVPGAAAAKERLASPYGTPKTAKSPLESPLVGDAKQMAALDLNPGTTKIDSETRIEFARFKAAQVQAPHTAHAAAGTKSSQAPRAQRGPRRGACSN